MEGEKKRKRGADHHHHHHHHNNQGQVNGVGELRRKDKDVAAPPVPAPVPVPASAQPSEEEVEEFFTILRRMNVAIKYFEKGGSGANAKGNGNGKVIAGKGAAGVNGGVKIGEREKNMGVVISGNGGPVGLDLNVIPETET